MTDTSQDSSTHKLLQQGAQALSDVELLTVLLPPSGDKSQDRVALAHELLNGFGDLSRLLEASRDEFHQQMGQTLTMSYVLLQAGLELSWRYLRERAKNECWCLSAPDAREFWYVQLSRQDSEALVVACFDEEQHLIDCEEIWCGSLPERLALEEQLVPKVVEWALQHQATAMIVAHYSPDGDGCPMFIDISALQWLQSALEAVCVTLSDYLVMGKGGLVSLKDRKFLG